MIRRFSQDALDISMCGPCAWHRTNGDLSNPTLVISPLQAQFQYMPAGFLPGVDEKSMPALAVRVGDKEIEASL